MFLQFFYALKAKKIPVTPGELIDLIHVLNRFSETKGALSLNEFYSIARNCLIKDIKYFDDYDLVFAEVFENLKTKDEEFRKLMETWLSQAADKELKEEDKEKAPQYNYDEVFEKLLKRLEEQKERHDGGSKWIGTRGVSPFGNSGFNPNGVKIGGGGGGRSAFDSINERNYREYRTDESLQVRQLKVALKKLKDLRKSGRMEFSVDKTIKRTVDNAGEIEIIEERSRKNHLKLLLLMDIGGSMTMHSERVSKLFSAAHQLNHFKEFHYYYFHNIIYDYVYETAYFDKRILVDDLIKKFRPDTKVIFVGDAMMHPYELLQKRERFFYRPEEKTRKELTGIERLKQLTEHFKSSIWINPENGRFWTHETVEAIWDLVPMYFLSLSGLERGIKKLMR